MNKTAQSSSVVEECVECGEWNVCSGGDALPYFPEITLMPRDATAIQSRMSQCRKLYKS